MRLAHAQYAQRDLDGALASLHAAVKLEPKHMEARELHAKIAALRKRAGQARSKCGAGANAGQVQSMEDESGNKALRTG